MGVKSGGRPGARPGGDVAVTFPGFSNAACAGEGGLFFPAGETALYQPQIEAAKALCAACPHLAECLEWALVNDERHGIWGGKTESERRALRRARRRAELERVVVVRRIPGAVH